MKGRGRSTSAGPRLPDRLDLVRAGDRAGGERLDRRRETSFTRTSEAAPYHVTVRSLGRFGGESKSRDMTRVEPARPRAGFVWS